MMLRVQRERMNAAFFPTEREYSRRYGLDGDRMARMPEHAIVMHPGPMVRGMEITAEVADSDRCTVVEQVTNGVSSGWPCCTCCWAATNPPSPTPVPPRRSNDHEQDPDPWCAGARRRAAGRPDRRRAIAEPSAAGLSAEGVEVVEADGKVLLPGLVDLHTHLREPGREDSETVLTGTRAAASGGFTAVFAMANTFPVADTAGVVEQV